MQLPLFQKLYIRNDKTLLENYRSATGSELVCRESTLSLVVSHSQVSLLLMVTTELVSCCFFLKHFMKRSKFSLNFHTAQEVLTHQVAPTEKKLILRKSQQTQAALLKNQETYNLKPKLETAKASADQGYLNYILLPQLIFFNEH